MPSKVNVNVPQTRYCIGKRNQASILGVWFAKTKVTTQIQQQPLENSIRIRLVSSALVHYKSINIKSIKSIDKSNTKCEEESIRIRWMGNLSFQIFLQEHILGNLTEISTCEKQKNRENTCQKKTITCITQYLCGSAICLRPWSYRDFTIIREKYNMQCGYKIFHSV